MQKYKVELKGLTAYMQHRMDDLELEKWEKQRGFIIERKDIHLEDDKRALFHSYMTDKGDFYLPGEHIKGALINAGALSKGKVGNAKKSMKNIVAAMFFINPEKIPFKGDFSVDKRSAVNRNIKARVVCIRPKFDNWSTEFEIMIDNDTITQETVLKIIQDAGQYVGIGSYSPRNNGWFGRFEVTKFEKL